MRMFDFLTSGAVFAGRRGWGVLAALGLACTGKEKAGNN